MWLLLPVHAFLPIPSCLYTSQLCHSGWGETEVGSLFSDLKGYEKSSFLGKVKVKFTQSCPTLCHSHGLYNPWNSLGKNTGMGSLPLLQGIFPTQGSNQGLPHCRQILYQLSHKGSPLFLTRGALSCQGVSLGTE